MKTFKPGQEFLGYGLDMDCRPVVVKCTFIEYVEPKEVMTWDNKVVTQDCVIESEGCRMLADSGRCERAWAAIINA